jgi:hypothetical protein
MVRIDPNLNEFEVLVVSEHLMNKGVSDYTLAQGYDCVWAYYGRINEYYIFRDGALADIQVD